MSKSYKLALRQIRWSQVDFSGRPKDKVLEARSSLKPDEISSVLSSEQQNCTLLMEEKVSLHSTFY